MDSLIREIVKTKKDLNAFYRIKSEPIARPPAATEQITALENEIKSRGLPVPPSYRSFLAIADGIDNSDIRLESASGVRCGAPAVQVAQVGLSRLLRFVIGAGNTAAFISFDPETAEPSGEMQVVWISEEGDEERYANFAAFLQAYRDLLTEELAAEQSDRANLRP